MIQLMPSFLNFSGAAFSMCYFAIGHPSGSSGSPIPFGLQASRLQTTSALHSCYTLWMRSVEFHRGCEFPCV